MHFLPAPGLVDPEELKMPEGINDGMAINSEGIYSSRPWNIYGEGPSTETMIVSETSMKANTRSG